MQVHDIKKPKHLKRKQRVGRGGKRGTYSGRGMKGQKSRAGARIRPQILDYIFKIPKLSGPTAKRGDAVNISKKQGAARNIYRVIINVGELNKLIKEGDTVNVDYLLENKIVKKYKGMKPKVKLLGNGTLTKKITVEGLELSKSAREQIEKIGGKIINHRNKKTKKTRKQKVRPHLFYCLGHPLRLGEDEARGPFVSLFY